MQASFVIEVANRWAAVEIIAIEVEARQWNKRFLCKSNLAGDGVFRAYPQFKSCVRVLEFC